MKSPSLKTIRQTFPSLLPREARLIKRLFTGALSGGSLYAIPAAQSRYDECYHPPAYEDLAIHVMDALLGTCGVEGLALDLRDGVSYCNTGDSYAPTIILLRLSGRASWHIMCWADMVEYLERRHLI